MVLDVSYSQVLGQLVIIIIIFPDWKTVKTLSWIGLLEETCLGSPMLIHAYPVKTYKFSTIDFTNDKRKLLKDWVLYCMFVSFL